jgi:hypothetical protein
MNEYQIPLLFSLLGGIPLTAIWLSYSDTPKRIFRKLTKSTESEDK